MTQPDRLPAERIRTAADLIDAGETGSAQPHAHARWDLAYEGLDGWKPPTVEQLERMLSTDGKAAMLEQALTLPLRGAVPLFDAPDGDRGQTEWVREHLTRPANAGGMGVPLDLVLAQQTAAVWQRRAYFEKVWRATPDGRVGYDKIAWRPAATCTLQRDVRTGAYRGFSQQVPKVEDDGRGGQRVAGTQTVTLGPPRSLVYIHGQHRNPLWGASDLELTWLIADTKRKIRFLWWKFLENVSFPSSTITTDATPQQTDELNRAGRMAAGLRSGGVLPLPAGWSLAAFDSNGQGASQFQAALDWLSAEQATSVLAGFSNLTDPGKSGGSYALSRDATDLFTAGRDSVLREIAATNTSYLVADLVRWNFGADAPSPRMRFAPLREVDLATTVELLQALADPSERSVVPPEFVEQLIVKVAGYLELDVDRVRRALQPERPTVDSSPVEQVAQVARTTERAARLVLARDAARAA